MRRLRRRFSLLFEFESVPKRVRSEDDVESAQTKWKSVEQIPARRVVGGRDCSGDKRSNETTGHVHRMNKAEPAMSSLDGADVAVRMCILVSLTKMGEELRSCQNLHRYKLGMPVILGAETCLKNLKVGWDEFRRDSRRSLQIVRRAAARNGGHERVVAV